MITDSALLKFADSLLASVDAVRGRWRHVHKMAFNSKASYLAFRLQASAADVIPDQIHAHTLRSKPSHGE
jgi:hypothetical protein